MKLIEATPEHIDEVAKLFDQYRQFYLCEPDLTLATDFITQRIYNRESSIFIAQDEQGDSLTSAGFVQLYSSFCSVDAIKILILYDLYVAEAYRKQGVGEMLMTQAAAFARAVGAKRIDLSTAKDNFSGQRLYEKLGYSQSLNDFYGYSLTLQ